MTGWLSGAREKIVSEYWQVCCLNFSRKLQPSAPSYYFDNALLPVLSKIKDFDLIGDSKLYFVPHYNYIISKGNSVFDCIKRFGSDFNDFLTLRLLFLSIVRPIVECGCVVWAPFYMTHIKRLEDIQ